MGARDLENGTVEVARRDTLTKEVVSIEGIDGYIAELLDTIQENIFAKAAKYREEHTTSVETYDEFNRITSYNVCYTKLLRVTGLKWMCGNTS